MPRPFAPTNPVTLEALWQGSQTNPRPLPTAPEGNSPPRESNFTPDALTSLPPMARRYLNWAIAPGTPLASAVRLSMHGTIKLNHQWHRFQGEEVICWPRGMIWRATTWMQGLPIFGADRLVDGVSDVRWKLLGLLPVMQATGDDVTRSAAGRIQGEAVWLPSVLCHPDVAWTELNPSQLQVNFTAFGEPAHLTFTVDGQGALQQVNLSRWGNPEGGDYHYANFGVIVEATGTFGGYTIPTQLRVGWFLGSDRFETEGEFFRCTLDRADYR
jgi:hypothetical protein